jgi:alpha-ribazole phosphatase
MKEIYLIRHPKVKINSGICYGWSDIELNLSSLEEIENLKQKLKDASDLVYFSSPLSRCKQVAESLSHKTVACFDELKELHFGDWELKAWDQIDAHELKVWTSNFISKKCPNGESYLDLYQRATQFWDYLMGQEFHKAAVITHAGVIRAILAHLLKIPLENSFSIQIDYSGVSKVDILKTHFLVRYINR